MSHFLGAFQAHHISAECSGITSGLLRPPFTRRRTAACLLHQAFPQEPRRGAPSLSAFAAQAAGRSAASITDWIGARLSISIKRRLMHNLPNRGIIYLAARFVIASLSRTSPRGGGGFRCCRVDRKRRPGSQAVCDARKLP